MVFLQEQLIDLSELKILNINQITKDSATQPRKSPLNLSHVQILMDEIEDGHELVPITVFYDKEKNTYLLADGYHRLEAHTRLNKITINCKVYQGTKRDAILASTGANGEHPNVLPRSRDDKYNAVTILLRDDIWGKWSSEMIAKQAKVSVSYVNKIKKDLQDLEDHIKSTQIDIRINTPPVEVKTPQLFYVMPSDVVSLPKKQIVKIDETDNIDDIGEESDETYNTRRQQELFDAIQYIVKNISEISDAQANYLKETINSVFPDKNTNLIKELQNKTERLKNKNIELRNVIIELNDKISGKIDD